MSSSQAVHVEYEDDGESLVSKTERLLAAAADNDIETLKQHLDSPEWYNVRDENGDSLLQIAISRRNDEVFDYLISLDDFSLDIVSDEGDTALDSVLKCISSCENMTYPHFHFHVLHSDEYENNPLKEVYERYAIELIKKEANTASYDVDERPLLHFAAFYSLPRMARLLIERGADLNELACGITPLQISAWNIVFKNGSPETLAMLLCYGADPLILQKNNYTAFDILFDQIIFKSSSYKFVALENLFFFTFDKLSSLSFICLLNLAYRKSPLFHEVMKLGCELSFDYSWEASIDVWCNFFAMDFEYLRILLERYPNIVKFFLDCSEWTAFCPLQIKRFDVKNLDMLIQNSVCSDSCIELFSKLCNSGHFIDLLMLVKNKGETIELIYYFLSYGIILKEVDLEYIYTITGYSQDFKNFLHMDFQNQYGLQIRKMMPRLIYDVTLDIHKIVENPFLCCFIDWKEIFHYFVHPKIQKAYRQLEPDEATKRQLPHLPLLQELARDAFRKYFIKRYEIKTARKFFTILKILRTRYQTFSHIIEKIITYESKLYYFVN